jgi:hypothetical protein
VQTSGDAHGGISAAYVQELEMMKHTAKIKEFLPILVSRKVKSFLRHPKNGIGHGMS